MPDDELTTGGAGEIEGGPGAGSPNGGNAAAQAAGGGQGGGGEDFSWMPSEMRQFMAESGRGAGQEPGAGAQEPGAGSEGTPPPAPTPAGGRQRGPDGRFLPAGQAADAGQPASGDVSRGTSEPPAPAPTGAQGGTAISDEVLASLPEQTRAALAGLAPEVRSELIRHYEGQAVETVRIEREQAEARDREQAQSRQQQDELRALNAQLLGFERREVKDENGRVLRTLPSYDEVQRLLRSDDGYRTLHQTYGMSESEARAQLDQWDDLRSHLSSNQDWFDRQAWGKLGFQLRKGLSAIEGIDPARLVDGVSGPDEVVTRLASVLEARHKAAIEALERRHQAVVTEYEDRIAGLNLNTDAMVRKVVAADPQITTGGRSGRTGELTPEALRESLNSPQAYARNREAILELIGR